MRRQREGLQLTHVRERAGRRRGGGSGGGGEAAGARGAGDGRRQRGGEGGRGEYPRREGVGGGLAVRVEQRGLRRCVRGRVVRVRVYVHR